MVRFQSDASSLANPHHYDSARSALSHFVLLFGESDADFGNRALRWTGHFVDEGLLLVIDVDTLRAMAVWGCSDGQTTVT